MSRIDVWIGSQGMPEARLVRLQTGRDTQSVNICRSSNVLGEYQSSYIIDDETHFLTGRDLGSCQTIDELIEKIRWCPVAVEQDSTNG